MAPSRDSPNMAVYGRACPYPPLPSQGIERLNIKGSVKVSLGRAPRGRFVTLLIITSLTKFQMLNRGWIVRESNTIVNTIEAVGGQALFSSSGRRC